MSVGSISFWQQDRNLWNEGRAHTQYAEAEASLINVMANATLTRSKGLSSIANGTALKRVNSQLIAAIQSVLQGTTGSNSTSGGTSSGAGSASAGTGSTPAKPASGIGTVTLTTGTTLSSLGILPGGTITISAGLNATTYTSTGTDTIGDLINAINVDLPTNAQVTASLNASGKLVITSRNTKDSIAIVGSGTDAADIGFGVGHSAFEPTKPSKSGVASANSSSSGGTSSSSGSTSSPSSSSSSSKAVTSNGLPSIIALTEQNLSSAAGILSGSGVSGTLVNMLT